MLNARSVVGAKKRALLKRTVLLHVCSRFATRAVAIVIFAPTEVDEVPDSRLPASSRPEITESNAGYATEASDLLQRYEAMSFESVHAGVLSFFPRSDSLILDIGAGTGRDAAYFADQGHRVVAVEPTLEMREGAMFLHPSPNIEWLDDRLPELDLLLKRSNRYDVILLNAVWMHLDLQQRVSGMQTIAELVHAGSRVFFKLRHGAVPEGRVMHEVSGKETIELGERHGLNVIHCQASASGQPHNIASSTTWTDVVLEKV